jgi:large subunit ribosomal protein L13
MRTFAPRPRDIERRWYVVDADGVVLGRLASHVAAILRGKHKPIFAPHADTGDHVIIVNAKGVVLTGQKAEKKIAYRHSGYPGGLTETRYVDLLAERPSRAVEKAIRGMLPKNSLGRQMLSKLHVYDGPEHPHRAQQPQALATGAVPSWDGLPAPKLAAVPAATPAPKAASTTTAKPAVRTTEKSAEKAKPVAKAAPKKAATAKAAPKKAATAKKTTAKPAAKKAAPAKKSTAKKPTTKKGK